jgi:hypothetical protein
MGTDCATAPARINHDNGYLTVILLRKLHELRKIILTEGKGAERPIADKQLETETTGVLNRGYQLR